MVYLDIRDYIDDYNFFTYNGNDENITFTGKIDKLIINKYYTRLDLSLVLCNQIKYYISGEYSLYEHKLPNNLQELDCEGCGIILLPLLNDKLKRLNCKNNNLYHLPELPNSLISLNCSYNNISELPELPKFLQKLECKNNKLILFPNIPKYIKYINVANNQILELPIIENKNLYLICYNNKFTYLPILPDNITLIYYGIVKYIDYNPNLNFGKDTKIHIQIFGSNEIIDSPDKYNFIMNRIKY